MTAIDETAQDIIFRKARTHNGWTDKPVDDSLLEKLYDLCKWGPTSANCTPMRLVFVKSKEAKERFKPLLDAGNQKKAVQAPVTAIIGMDMKFYDQLPKLFPQADAKSWFEGNEEKVKITALRNSSLQGAYFIIAARSLGLDCGPMSGFDNAKVDAEFFKDTSYKSNFICSIGYGDPAKLYPRNPRLPFSEACKIV